MEITNGRISDNVTLDAASLLPSFSFISYLFHFALYLPHAVSLSLLTDLFLLLLLFPSASIYFHQKKKLRVTPPSSTHTSTQHTPTLLARLTSFPRLQLWMKTETKWVLTSVTPVNDGDMHTINVMSLKSSEELTNERSKSNLRVCVVLVFCDSTLTDHLCMIIYWASVMSPSQSMNV